MLGLKLRCQREMLDSFEQGALHFHFAVVPVVYGAGSTLCIGESKGKFGNSLRVSVRLSLRFDHARLCTLPDVGAGAFATVRYVCFQNMCFSA